MIILLLVLIIQSSDHSPDFWNSAFWAALFTAVGVVFSALFNYLSKKHNSDNELTKIQMRSNDEKTEILLKELDDATRTIKQLEAREREAEKTITALRLDISILKVKFNTLREVLKDLNKDKPDIIRIIENIERQDAK